MSASSKQSQMLFFGPLYCLKEKTFNIICIFARFAMYLTAAAFLVIDLEIFSLG
jgi:hypothetical protein